MRILFSLPLPLSFKSLPHFFSLLLCLTVSAQCIAIGLSQYGLIISSFHAHGMVISILPSSEGVYLLICISFDRVISS